MLDVPVARVVSSVNRALDRPQLSNYEHCAALDWRLTGLVHGPLLWPKAALELNHILVSLVHVKRTECLRTVIS